MKSFFCVLLNRHNVLVFGGGLFHSDCSRCGQNDDWNILERFYHWAKGLVVAT